jgi:adenylate cyclase
MDNDAVARWLLEEAPGLPDMRSVVKGLVDRLVAEGMPLIRVNVGVGMLHPEMLAAIYTWDRGDLFVRRSEVRHGVEKTDIYLESPFRLLNEGQPSVRRRLTGAEAEVDFPILEEVREGGATDYLAIGLPRSDGEANRCSFSVDRPEGFTEEEIERLVALRPVLAVIVELQARARMTRTLLELYLGPDAGPRVYHGEIKRGEGETIRSVLWISDLRGVTRLSEGLPLESLTAVLNDYFDAMIGPIHAHGGEVMKLIGDGVLACFRIDNEADVPDICERALGAAELAMANMTILNRRRRREDKPPLDCGIGLHVGDAMYGNVGTHDRLDFTVIGPAVNLCARLESLTGKLGEPIVCSAEFAENSRDPMRCVGSHALKNVDGLVEAFAPGET